MSLLGLKILICKLVEILENQREVQILEGRDKIQPLNNLNLFYLDTDASIRFKHLDMCLMRQGTKIGFKDMFILLIENI